MALPQWMTSMAVIAKMGSVSADLLDIGVVPAYIATWNGITASATRNDLPGILLSWIFFAP